MYFIRHGQSEFNLAHDKFGRDPDIQDAPLTDRGLEQARRAAKELMHHGIKDVISSPYTRALQTAEVIASELKAQIHVDPLAGERCLYSCDIGTSRSQLKRNWPTLDFSSVSTDHWWPRQNESMAALQKRADLSLDKWHFEMNGSGFALVSHRYFLYSLTGQGLENGEVLFQNKAA